MMLDYVDQMPYTVTADDCNVGHHLDHARFVSLFTMARFSWTTHYGLTLDKILGSGLGINVAELTIKYRAEVFEGDHLVIETRQLPTSTRAMAFEQIMRREGTVVAEQSCRVVFVSAATRGIMDWRTLLVPV